MGEFVIEDKNLKPRVFSFKLVGKIPIKLREATLGDTIENNTNLVNIAKALIQVGDEDLTNFSVDDKVKMLKAKNITIFNYILNKYNEFLSSEADVEEDPSLTDSKIVEDLFNKGTVMAKYKIKNAGRVAEVTLQLPILKETLDIGNDLLDQISYYCISVNNYTKSSLGKRWKDFISALPLAIGTKIPEIYQKLFDRAMAILDSPEKVEEEVQNL